MTANEPTFADLLQNFADRHYFVNMDGGHDQEQAFQEAKEELLSHLNQQRILVNSAMRAALRQMNKGRPAECSDKAFKEWHAAYKKLVNAIHATEVPFSLP